ncbi:MAG: methionyl-tRNA formyltransferase [Culturomica sp.]|jgi:methionyl-tRNA formyltransferase|nr:methionyl-tRNA formyltransferase [Culturomica sp.]
MTDNGLRIVYMGTPEFAVYPLAQLIENGYNVVGVVTNPDKPAGRGQKLQESAVKEYSVKQGLPILQPEKFKDDDFLKVLKSWNADLNIVVAFKMLPQVVWNMPRLGTMNLHASLLPDYRGAAPINRVIMNGEDVTGVTTFLLNHGMDTGSLLLQKRVAIGESMTAGELHDELMIKGASLLTESIDLLASGNYRMIKQDEVLHGRVPKMAPKIFKEDMKINWKQKLGVIYNQVRGLSPFPAAWTELRNTINGEIVLLKIFKVTRSYNNNDIKFANPQLKTDYKTYLEILLPEGSLFIEELQISGRKRMKIQEFLRGFRPDNYEIIDS